MRNRVVMSAVAFLVVVGLSASVWAAPKAKTYQVTGPVLEVLDGKVIVQKGDEKWEIATDKDTKITGELKVGAKVTIEYQMFATTVEVKGDAKAADAKKEEPMKEEKK